MPELFIPIFVFYLIYLYFNMKKIKPSTEMPVPKSKKQPIAVVASETKPKKAQVVASYQVEETPEITPPERIGLTTCSIWHYLSENGASPFAKLVRALPEEEKVIQSSIGWLAQKGKITLEHIDRFETISLTE